MNFEVFRNHNFQKFQSSKIFDFDTENTIRRPKIHQSGTRLRCPRSEGTVWNGWKMNMVRSTLLPNRLWGATLENRGVLHSVGPDPFRPIFLPLKERSRSHSGMGPPWFLTIFRMAFTIFLWGDRKCWRGAPYWSLFGGHHDRKHKNEHQEAPKWFQMILNDSWIKK